MYPFITLPLHLDTFIPTNRYYLPVLSSVVLHIRRLPFHQLTGSISFFNWLYMRTYLSTHLLVWVPIDPPKYWMYLVILMLLVNHEDLPAEPTCRINYHVHRCTSSKTLPVHFYSSISKYFNISLIIIWLVCKDFKKRKKKPTTVTQSRISGRLDSLINY